jgi:hypothetical protein
MNLPPACRVGVQLAALVAGTLAAAAQQGPAVEERLNRLEAENRELQRRIELLADELERQDLGAIVRPLGQGAAGLGPGASKVYGSPGGVSIGGYGEALFRNRQGGDDEADALRTVLYVGYKFDDDWIFNSEIEFEHGFIADGADGEAAIEFAYLDRRFSDAFNARAGVLLVPLGFINERHEPTTFLSSNRPFVERFVIPATWRELGAGAWGAVGAFDWRAYVLGGMDARGFSDAGIRGGRQNASKALANDLAFAGRLDWRALDTVTAGVGAYWGYSGQGQIPAADVATTLIEAHAEARWRALSLRALAAQTWIEDAGQLNASLGLGGADAVGSEIFGGYVEAGWDVLSTFAPAAKASLEPFVRYEAFDTQAKAPAGFARDPANDVRVVTLGVAYRPNDSIVFKADYSDFANGLGEAQDQFTLSMGFVF